MFKSKVPLLVLSLLFIAIFSVETRAQAVYRSISGTVTDAQGAVIPDATVTITSGTVRVVLSDNAGGYVVADAIRLVPTSSGQGVPSGSSPLPPGRARHAGFIPPSSDELWVGSLSPRTEAQPGQTFVATAPREGSDRQLNGPSVASAGKWAGHLQPDELFTLWDQALAQALADDLAVSMS